MAKLIILSDQIFKIAEKLKNSSLNNIKFRLEPKGDHEAEQKHNIIEIYPKFFKHPKKLQYEIIAHELGHWFREQYISMKDIAGWEEGEGFKIYYLSNFEEGFAEGFMAYLFDPNDFKKKYPKQFEKMKEWVGNKNKYITWIKSAVKKILEMKEHNERRI